MDPTKTQRANIELPRKPYRSTASSYDDYKKEIPDANYYGLKHSEFKKPWLENPGGYDEMEYKWDYPLEWLDPITIDFEFPDGWVYPFPGGLPWSPDWIGPGLQPGMPQPTPNTGSRKKPNQQISTLTWQCKAPFMFEWCPGDTVTLYFEEAHSNRIYKAEATEGAQAVVAGRISNGAGSATGKRAVEVTIPTSVQSSWITVTAYTRTGSCSITGSQKSTCDIANPCEDVGIGYTSSSMGTGESQSLTITNQKPGVNYTWNSKGGGTLRDAGAGTAQFTSPETNENCLQNGEIELRADGQVCATLNIGVTAAITHLYNAYRYIRDEGLLGTNIRPGLYPFCADVRWTREITVRCDDVEIEAEYSSMCWGPETYACSSNPGWTNSGLCDFETKTDLRTPEIIAQGCCPGGLA